MSIPNSIAGNASPIIGSSADTAAPATGSDAVLTYAAAGVGVSHVIGCLYFSSDADLTGQTLKIADGATVVWGPHRITKSGPGFEPMIPPLKGTTNTAMTITLTGVSSINSCLTARHWTEGPQP